MSVIDNPSRRNTVVTVGDDKNPSPGCKTGPGGVTRGHACAMGPAVDASPFCRRNLRKVTL